MADSERTFVPELTVDLKIPFASEDGASYYASWAADLIASELNISKQDVKIRVVNRRTEVKK